jgi:hypothetical protein
MAAAVMERRRENIVRSEGQGQKESVYDAIVAS